MGISAEVTRLVNKKINELAAKRENISYTHCDKCGYGSIAHGKKEVAEWNRLHNPHNVKTLRQKLKEIPIMILDKLVSAIHREIDKK